MDCRSRHNCQRIWGIIVLLVAIVLAVFLAIAAPNIGLVKLASVIRFFQFMLIILGVGALIKYLFSCGSCGCGYGSYRKEVVNEPIGNQPKY